MSKIIMYSTSTWPHCTTAKSFLREKGYEFEVKDLNEDNAAREDFSKRGLRGVPAFLIDGQVVEGLDTAKIDSLMKNMIIKCPNCDSKLRVPRNKGKISITCPKCSTSFEKDTGAKK